MLKKCTLYNLEHRLVYITFGDVQCYFIMHLQFCPFVSNKGTKCTVLLYYAHAVLSLCFKHGLVVRLGPTYRNVSFTSFVATETATITIPNLGNLFSSHLGNLLAKLGKPWQTLEISFLHILAFYSKPICQMAGD